MTITPVADQQVLRSSLATIRATIRDQEGEPADLTGLTVKVTVTRADGTVLVNDQTATLATTQGDVSYQLSVANTSTLDFLTATWSISSVVRTTTKIEIVGGYLFSLADARAADRAFAEQRYTDEQILDARAAVDDEFSRICGVAFTPRYRRTQIDGSGRATLVLPDPMVRAVRKVRVSWSASTVVDFDSTQLALCQVEDAGILRRIDWWEFPCGYRNVEVHYEHGYDIPPPEVARAAITRTRERLSAARSAIPDRATSFSVAEGGTYRLDTAGARKTGNPEIDAVLARHTWNMIGQA